MGLWDRLFGRKTAAATTQRAEPTLASAPEADDAASAPPIDPVLQPALTAFQRGEHLAAYAAAQPQLQRGADAQRLCALSLSALDRYAEAYPHWLALYELEPSAHNALQLATTSVMCNEIARGEQWLLTFDDLNAQERSTSPATARTSFLTALTRAGHGAHALPHLEWLREAYAGMSITDSHFLYVRGLPFLETFLERSAPLLQQCLPAGAVAAWYAQLQPSLDPPGQAAVAVHIASLR
ncbi:hypothetical protein JWH11_09470 [Xanthomonas melonis]|uniref:Uncharacterized protein n=1 Tax=Xanthomonas melonis TaxID=56456 RepID=A0ABS8NUA5_9XANT|nr:MULTISPECIES: hypothetical protein [Xanthomonas]MCC4589242.1 hypothetical protein [Xanthomonas sp. NCPPB 1067]MCD0245062.1 hypothetical protein [Xanthomonas melonis]MCD0258435.1 hypothetical protein [Xanthomonas melonis]MCD0266655.1 hypothetical protein [Xanthomonas melonis]MCD0278599.1 hypothetical protein [Xanthomonas melonis]